MKYERTTATERKAAAIASMRYLHVSVLVGTAKDPATGCIVPTRTQKGKGGTARRATAKLHGRARREALAKAAL